MSTLPSNPCNVPETLRSIVREGNAWPSAGIIGEAANLLDDADTLLGRLAECFGDDETEFADIKLMRDRIADVDTRARHDATVDSARAHGNETCDQRGPYCPETNAACERMCQSICNRRASKWQPLETAPKGVLVEGLNTDGEVDRVEYRETRQCMLSTVARGAGECGAGWVSKEAGNLPVDPPIAWRPIQPPAQKANEHPPGDCNRKGLPGDTCDRNCNWPECGCVCGHDGVMRPALSEGASGE